jgi:SulP family sulfate permease
MILRMRHVLVLDASGIRAIEDLHKWCRRGGTQLILEGVHAQPLVALRSAGMLETLGMENMTTSLDGALARAEAFLSSPMAKAS